MSVLAFVNTFGCGFVAAAMLSLTFDWAAARRRQTRPRP